MSRGAKEPVTGREQRIHIGDTGTVFQFALGPVGSPVDLTGATKLEVWFQKPDGTAVGPNAATLVGAATTGIVQVFTDRFGQERTLQVQLTWTDAAGIFDAAGTWKRWVFVETPTFAKKGTVTEFEVFA